MGQPRDSLAWTIRRAAAANRGGSGVRPPPRDEAEAAWAGALPAMQLAQRTPQRWNPTLPPRPSPPEVDTSVDLPPQAWPRVDPPVVTCINAAGAFALRGPRGVHPIHPGVMLDVLLERLGHGSFDASAGWMLMVGLTRALRIVAEHTLAPMPALDDVLVCQRGMISIVAGPDEEGLQYGTETRYARRAEGRQTLLRLWAALEGRGVFDMQDPAFAAVFARANDVVRASDRTFETLEKALFQMAPISHEGLDALVTAALPPDLELFVDEAIGQHRQRVAAAAAAARDAAAAYDTVVATIVAEAKAREAVLAEHLQVDIERVLPPHVPEGDPTRFFALSYRNLNASLLTLPPTTTPTLLKLFEAEQARQIQLHLFASRTQPWKQHVPVLWPYMVWQSVRHPTVITLARHGNGVVHDVAYAPPIHALRCAFVERDGTFHGARFLRLRGSRQWPRRCPRGVPLSRVLSELSASAIAVIAADISDELDDVVDAANDDVIVVWEPTTVDNIHIGIDGRARVLAPSAVLVDDPGPHVAAVRRCAPERINNQVVAYRVGAEAVVGRAPSLSPSLIREGRAEIEALVQSLIDDDIMAAYDVAADLASLSLRDFQVMAAEHPLFAQLAADAETAYPSNDDDDDE